MKKDAVHPAELAVDLSTAGNARLRLSGTWCVDSRIPSVEDIEHQLSTTGRIDTFAFDTETTGLNPVAAALVVAVAAAGAAGVAVWVAEAFAPAAASAQGSATRPVPRPAARPPTKGPAPARSGSRHPRPIQPMPPTRRPVV